MDYAGIAVDYLGWSGFRIAGRDALVLLDPPNEDAIPREREAAVLISHGHPEHVGALRSHLETNTSGAPLTIVASAAICRHLAKRTKRPGVRFVAVGPGDALAPAWSVGARVFGWRHFPLFPPGAKARARHIKRLISRCDLAAKIAWAGLTGPRASPMLGFDLEIEGARLIAYGEGLHRRTRAPAVAEACGAGKAALLLLAVEPEDADALPFLVKATRAESALLFEPHAPWRDAFGMERADLAAVKRAIEAIGIPARIA